MIRVDMKMPESCAQCPLLMKVPFAEFFPTWLCRIRWKQVDMDGICKHRPEWCPMKEDKDAENQQK